MRTRGTYLVTLSVPSDKLSVITPGPRKMAKRVNWTEEEKRQMVTMRNQNQHMSWEEFQKNLWPTRTAGALAFMYSEVNRMDRLRATVQDQNIPERSPSGHSLPDQPLSATTKRPSEAMRQGETTCETANTHAQAPHAVKRPCTEHSNEMTEQQIAVSPDRGHPKSTDPQSPEASLTRQKDVNTSSPTLTVDNVIHLHPCQSGNQSELTETIQVEEEAVNGLPRPCSIAEAVSNKAIPSGPTPVQQSGQPACHFQEVDPLVVNGIENEIADLAQRFCDDISVVRKRRKMVEVQQSELTVAFSSLLSNFLDLKHKVEQREEEGNQAQNALKQLQQQMENKIKEAVKKAVSELSQENDRLRSESRARSRNTVELKRRHDELETENTTLKGILKGISTTIKPFDST